MFRQRVKQAGKGATEVVRTSRPHHPSFYNEGLLGSESLVWNQQNCGDCQRRPRQQIEFLFNALPRYRPQRAGGASLKLFLMMLMR